MRFPAAILLYIVVDFQLATIGACICARVRAVLETGGFYCPRIAVKCSEFLNSITGFDYGFRGVPKFGKNIYTSVGVHNVISCYIAPGSSSVLFLNVCTENSRRERFLSNCSIAWPALWLSLNVGVWPVKKPMHENCYKR